MASIESKAFGTEWGQVLGRFAPGDQVCNESPGRCTQGQPQLTVTERKEYVFEPITTIDDRFGVRQKWAITHAVFKVVDLQLRKDLARLLQDDLRTLVIRRGIGAGELDRSAYLQASGHRREAKTAVGVNHRMTNLDTGMREQHLIAGNTRQRHAGACLLEELS